jgi:hypothetical protein
MKNRGQHDNLVLRALQQLSVEDAERHLAEVEAFYDCFWAGLAGTDNLLFELQGEVFARRRPRAGPQDPTWIAWAAWAELELVRRALAGLDV